MKFFDLYPVKYRFFINNEEYHNAAIIIQRFYRMYGKNVDGLILR